MLDRNIWSGKSTETALIDQADAVAKFSTAGWQHSLVAGLELSRDTSAPEYDNSTGVPTVSLTQPNPNVPFNAANTYKRLTADTVGKSAAVYAVDTVDFSPQWELTAGLRWIASTRTTRANTSRLRPRGGNHLSHPAGG